MVKEDFWYFRKMTKDFINMNKTNDRENAKFQQIRIYSISKGDPIVTIKYCMNARPAEMNLFQSGRTSADMKTSPSPKPAYSAPLGTDSRKIKDLLAMCDKQITRVSRAYHAFNKILTIGLGGIGYPEKI